MCSSPDAERGRRRSMRSVIRQRAWLVSTSVRQVSSTPKRTSESTTWRTSERVRCRSRTPPTWINLSISSFARACCTTSSILMSGCVRLDRCWNPMVRCIWWCTRRTVAPAFTWFRSIAAGLASEVRNKKSRIWSQRWSCCRNFIRCWRHKADPGSSMTRRLPTHCWIRAIDLTQCRSCSTSSNGMIWDSDAGTGRRPTYLNAARSRRLHMRKDWRRFPNATSTRRWNCGEAWWQITASWSIPTTTTGPAIASTASNTFVMSRSVSPGPCAQRIGYLQELRGFCWTRRTCFTICFF